jgi:hypothetical protein
VIGYGDGILAGMKDMLSQGLMTDVTIVAGGKEFDAHKLVLATGSDFFKTKFAASTSLLKEKLTLSFDFLLPETFEIILQSLYTGRIKVPDNMVASVVRLAAQVRDYCLFKSTCSTRL